MAIHDGDSNHLRLSLVVLLLVAYLPQISMALPHLLRDGKRE
ncbi:MAG: hypothetical protein ACLTLQ_14385 [[Clostridium] scindens]